MKLLELKNFLDHWAPPPVAEAWDNVGLLVGDVSAEISCVMVALEVTDQVIREAAEHEAQAIITHHPLIFKPLRRITSDSRTGRLVTRLIQNNIALYSMHTNLDSVERGVNYALAEILRIRPEGFLKPMAGDLKRVTFSIAQEKADAVMDTLMNDGVFGGNGDAPVFYRSENRSFDPASEIGGDRGERIELVLESWRVRQVSEVLRDLMPQPVIEIQALDQPSIRFGLGLVGVMEKPMPFDGFTRFVREQLNIPAVRIGGEFNGTVQKIALCGGSGGGFIADAVAAGADAFVTGEIRYHDFQEFGEKIGLVDAGHYETERPVLENIRKEITRHFGTGKLLVHVTECLTNPVSYVT